jgi:hypothetical protein
VLVATWGCEVHQFNECSDALTYPLMPIFAALPGGRGDPKIKMQLAIEPS